MFQGSHGDEGKQGPQGRDGQKVRDKPRVEKEETHVGPDGTLRAENLNYCF